MARTKQSGKVIRPGTKAQPEPDISEDDAEQEFEDEDYLGGPSTNRSQSQLDGKAGRTWTTAQAVKEEEDEGSEGSQDEDEDDQGSIGEDGDLAGTPETTDAPADTRVDVKGKARASPAPPKSHLAQKATKPPKSTPQGSHPSNLQQAGGRSQGHTTLNPQSRQPNGRSSATQRTPPNAEPNDIHTPPAIRKLKREAESLRQAKVRAESRMEREMQRLQDELDAVKEERDTFKKQFDELIRIRHTEAEAETRELEEITSAQAATQDALIQTLTAEIAGMEELSRNGHTHGLKLLTREATDARLRDLHRALERKDEEMQALKNENTGLQEEIAELKESVQILKSDLTQEKEHWTQEVARLSQRQMAHPATSSPRNTRPDNFSKKVMRNTEGIDKETINFLSDLSGCVILKVTPGEGWDGHSPAPFTFKCLFTANEIDALAFEVTVCPPTPSPSNPTVMDEEVIYQPLLSESGPLVRPEFMDKLGFLSGPFSFQRSQLHVMGKTLLNQIQADSEDNDEEDNYDDESEMEVER
ncbi:hypothetical protein FRB95_011594 [Tulasnella sp. JGI-2019a]|nr:hypothetical protein FRB93_004819 [Tulasnella sp. JGI-2019a]KAG9035299.1 hypothetical protein FRB95_011594 [Tulasnella sp. JGI-2019a]